MNSKALDAKLRSDKPPATRESRPAAASADQCGSSGEMGTMVEIMKTMKQVRSAIPADLWADARGYLPPRPSHVFSGIQIVSTPYLPDQQPAIQVRDIRLKDGTPLLSDAFLARENAAWTALHGMRDVAFFVEGALAANPRIYDLVRRAGAAVDDELLRSLMAGRQP